MNYHVTNQRSQLYLLPALRRRVGLGASEGLRTLPDVQRLRWRRYLPQLSGRAAVHAYYTVDEKFPFGHGEKSVFLINEHMRLTREEALAIRFHMGDFTDRNTGKAYEICPLALQLHIADLQATYLDESAQALGKGV